MLKVYACAHCPIKVNLYLTEWQPLRLDLLFRNLSSHKTMDFSKCGRGFKKCGTMNYVCVAVYLQASPETCQSRIKKRNRHEEQDVPIVSGPLGFKIRLSVCKTTSTTRSKAIIMYCPVVPTIARDEKSQG